MPFVRFTWCEHSASGGSNGAHACAAHGTAGHHGCAETPGPNHHRYDGLCLLTSNTGFLAEAGLVFVTDRGCRAESQ